MKIALLRIPMVALAALAVSAFVVPDPATLPGDAASSLREAAALEAAHGQWHRPAPGASWQAVLGQASW